MFFRVGVLRAINIVPETSGHELSVQWWATGKWKTYSNQIYRHSRFGFLRGGGGFSKSGIKFIEQLGRFFCTQFPFVFLRAVVRSLREVFKIMRVSCISRLDHSIKQHQECELSLAICG